MQSEELKSQRGFTLADLISNKKNVVLETINDFDVDCEEDEECGFPRDRNFTNQEILQHLNIEDDANGENDALRSEREEIVPCCISFDNLKPRMDDISGEGKVFKLVKQPGVGEVVPEESMVTVHYMGFLEYADEPFDSTYLRQNRQKVRLNRGQLLLGLDLAISTMKKHEIAQFIIHPDYAYGCMGCPPRIPPNAEVMFAVHLLDYLDNAAADTYENLQEEEKKSLALARPRIAAIMVTAKDELNRKNLREAVRRYNQVISILNKVALNDAAEEEEYTKFFKRALVNLAMCHYKLNEPRKACMMCNTVPVPYAKASYWHGKALMSMGEYDNAMREFHKAKQLAPGDRDVHREIKELNERIRKYKEEDKKRWSKCLSVRTEDEGMTEFAHYAREICESLVNNEDLMRLNLRSGLNDRELDCFREQAATLDLSFTTRERYGKVEYYICKPNYENQRRG